MQPYKPWYGTQRWRATSAWVLARDGWVCQTPGCPRRATTADHLIPAVELFESGRPWLFWAPQNLVARCRSCNSRRGAVLVNGRARSLAGAQRRAEAWAERYEADMARLERERRASRPAIY